MLGAAHGLDNLLRQESAFAEIDVGLHGGARDVGIGSQVNDGVVAVHVAFERGQILDVAADHTQPAILLVMRVVPFAAARKVVVEGDGFGALVAQQPVCEMAADESGAAGDERSVYSWFPVIGTDSHLVAARCKQRMADQQMPEHGAKPFGVRRDAIRRERGNHDALFGQPGE